MDASVRYIWAKTSRNEDERWHPLVLHVLDVAASAEAILEREPDSTRVRMGEVFGMQWSDARPWLLLVIACHDLGKASPGFQCKWPNIIDLTCLKIPRSPNTEVNHAFISQLALSDLLQSMQWPEGIAELVSDAVGCHHGERASPSTLNDLMGDRRALGSSDWTQARESIFRTTAVQISQSDNPSPLVFR